MAEDNEHTINLISNNGTITIKSSKTNGVKNSILAHDPSEMSYHADIYGVSVENNGTANLNAGTDIIITAGYDETAAKKYTSLKQGNIYGIYNTGGTVDLTAGNTISITANSANGNAYGIYTDSDEDTKLNGNVNITAVADENGKAYGIYAENGSKVDINGYTSVSGDNGAIVIIGKDNAAVPLDGENDFQVTVGGNLTAGSAEGAAITVEKNGSLHVTGDQVINNTFEIKDNSTAVINGSLAGIGIIAENTVNVSGSSLTVGGNVSLDSEKIGMNITENSNVTIEGKVAFGTNYIGGSIAGIDVDSSILNINSGNTIIASLNNALVLNDAQVTIGDEQSINAIMTDSGNAISIKGDKEKSQLTLKGKQNIITTNSDKMAAIYLTESADVDINGTQNTIAANVDANGYGATHSIKADDGSTFTMGGENAVNSLYGVIYTKDSDTSVTLNGSNYIRSSTHGSQYEGREHVVAALYAQSDSNITLNAGENGRNVIVSDFEFQEGDKHKDDSERTIWAQQGGKITINGATEITASNSGEYTDGHKGNSRGIAITAGTGQDLDQFVQDNKLVGIEDKDRSTVTLNYAGNSLIKGDIVSGYGGLVTVNGGYITENGTQVALNDSAKGSLNMQGNALAANGGKLSLDLGNGGTWYGRADDYGDAGIDTSGNHTKFYNPAFSNEIIEGGTVSVTMHNQSKWVLTGQSWVSTLTANNSIIDMANAGNVEAVDNDHTHALTIGTFSGTGSTFIMDLDAQDRGQSDMLYIKDNQGTFNVQLKDALTDEDLESLEGNGLRFATINGVDPGFGEIGVFDKGSVVRYAGTGFSEVTYEVKEEEYQSGDNSENDIYNNGSDNKVKANGENSFENGKPGQEFVDKMFGENGGTNLIITGVAGRQTGGIGQTIIDMSKANYTNAIYMDRLNKRMGETRFIDGDEGMWVRMRHDRIGKEDSFRSMNTMYEMGYDVKQEKDNGEHRVGVAIDYMDGSTSYSKLGGDGEISRKGIWMYDTWVGEKGHYRDFVAKWGHLSNDFDVYAGTGDNVTGDYSNNVYSISAEFGKKNDIGNNWYFEPQAQLQYAHVTGAEYMTSAGTAVNVDDINSLIARAGFRLGKDIGERSTVYFKADLMHEFLGEQDVFAMDDSTGTSGAHERYDHGGTWCDLGFGFATAMSKTSYAYLDVETSLGNDYDETYQINAGLQWTF